MESTEPPTKRLKQSPPESSDAPSQQQQWHRPAVVWDASKPLIFQQMECDHYMDYKANRAVLRFYGVTQEGHSVLAHIHDFVPYLFVPAPEDYANEESSAARLQRTLEDRIGQKVKEHREQTRVLGIELVHTNSIYGYTGGVKRPFLKISVAVPRYVGILRGIWEELTGLSTFESNLEYALRYMVDQDIQGASWIEIPGGEYMLVQRTQWVGDNPKDRWTEKTSHCQIEVHTSHQTPRPKSIDGEWSKLGPLRTLSFDIECSGRKGYFPEAEHDPVIQIANMITVQGESQPRIKNVFTLGTCAPITGSQVLSFETEYELLRTWRDFVVASDPDVITGYNINGFDLPYLLNRAAALGVETFPYLGRIVQTKTEMKNATFSSKAYGTRESKAINIEGRIQFDVLQIIQRDYKLRSYTLNSVGAHFLGEQKEDVHYSIISDLQNGTDETRRRLAVYCLKDAYLPQRLIDKLMCLVNYIEMARVTGVPFNYLLTRGQQIKVVSQLYRKAKQRGLLIPALKKEGDQEQYEGATVIDPIRGYYDYPIATLDFSSLYPSIMMAHNLCYSTLLTQELVKEHELTQEEYIRTPTGDLFAKKEKMSGLLPEILTDLISARNRAKADLKKEKDPFKKAVLDGRQLALKISANSVYGFTGATVGKLPCLQISSSVTAFGRQMIEKTKSLVQERYTIANGYDYDAVVIYGDTDSVMVKFGYTDLAKVMELGQEAAKFVTTHFVKPISLEFEKVYFPYLLINKKRYAGLYWTKPDKWDKMDTKGIETVRRDNCRLVKTVIEHCLNKILIDRDVQGAITYTQGMISDLLQNKVDMSQLVISKSLSKQGEDYAAKQAHVTLAEKMKKRDPATAPALGDRVPYVIVKGIKGSPAYDKAEDPIYVLNNGLPIDFRYYLDNQLSKPLTRIFEPIMGEKVSTLLTGEHTRTVVIPTPVSGGMMKFIKKVATCMGCKTPLKGEQKTVCEQCKKNEPGIYQRQLGITNNLEQQFSRLWTQCQRCQGSLHAEVLCSSRDCPIFYMRTRVKKDLQEATETLKRFDMSW